MRRAGILGLLFDSNGKAILVCMESFLVVSRVHRHLLPLVKHWLAVDIIFSGRMTKSRSSTARYICPLGAGHAER